MKVSGNGFDFSAAQTLLPVGPAGKGGAGEIPSQASGAADPQDFGSLLSKGVSDAGSAIKPAKSESNGVQSASRSGAPKGSSGTGGARGSQSQRGGVSSADSNCVSNSQAGDSLFSSAQSAPGGANDSGAPELDVKADDTGESLVLGFPDLPPDPRLADPTELAMEAAAVAALSAASSVVVSVPVQSRVPAESDGSGVAIQVSVQGNGAGSQGGLFGQLAQMAPRASSSEVSVPAQVLASASPVGISPVQQSEGADFYSNVSLLGGGPVVDQADRSDSQVHAEASAGVRSKGSESSFLDASSSLPDAVVSFPVEGLAQSALVLPISSPLISLTATSAQLAALVAASSQKAGSPRAIASERVVAPVALPVNLPGDVRSAVLAAEVLSTNDADSSVQGASIVAAGSAEEPVVQPESAPVDIPGAAQDDVSGKAGAVGVGDGGKNASGSGLEQESKAPEQGVHSKPDEANAQFKAGLRDAVTRSGTRDANESAVPKEETSVRVRATAESLPASTDEAPQSSPFADRADSNQSGVTSVFGAGNRPHLCR